VETIGSKRSYALIWCMPNNDDDDTEHEMTNAVKPGGSTGRAVACLSQDKDTFQQLNADLFPVVMVIDV